MFKKAMLSIFFASLLISGCAASSCPGSCPSNCPSKKGEMNCPGQAGYGCGCSAAKEGGQCHR